MFALTILFSFVYYPQLAYAVGLGKLNQGFNVLTGNPVYYNGHLWRLNETNYIIKSKGSIVNIETDQNLGDFNQCYSVGMFVSLNPYYISFNETKVPGDYSQCLTP